MKSTVDLYKDKGGEWRWRLKASNGRIIASSGEGFTRKISCSDSFYNVAEILAEGDYGFNEDDDDSST